jgi:hypothetical protein
MLKENFMENNGMLNVILAAAITTEAGGPAAALNFTYPKDDPGFDSFGKRLSGYMGTDSARLGIAVAAVNIVDASTVNYSAKLDAVRNVP